MLDSFASLEAVESQVQRSSHWFRDRPGPCSGLGVSAATNDGLGYQAKLWTATTGLHGRRQRSCNNCSFTPSISLGQFHVCYSTCLAPDCVEICALPIVRQEGFCLLHSRCIRIVHSMNENLEASPHANCTNSVWVPGLLTCMNDLQTSRFSLHSVSLLAWPGLVESPRPNHTDKAN
jgi:hypothetical protein